MLQIFTLYPLQKVSDLDTLGPIKLFPKQCCIREEKEVVKRRLMMGGTVAAVINELKELNKDNIKTRFELLQAFLKLFSTLPIEQSSTEDLISTLKFPKDFFDRLTKIIRDHKSRCKEIGGIVRLWANSSPETHAQVDEIYKHLLRLQFEGSYRKALKSAGPNKAAIEDDYRKNIKNLPAIPKTRTEWETLLVNACINIPPTCQSHKELQALYNECNAVSEKADQQARAYRPEAAATSVAACEILKAFSEGTNDFATKVTIEKDKETAREIEKIHEENKNNNQNEELNEELLRVEICDFLGVSQTQLLMVLCHMYVAPKPDYLKLKGEDIFFDVNNKEPRYRKILLNAIAQICEGKTTVKNIVEGIEQKVETSSELKTTNKNIIDAIIILKKQGRLNMAEPLPVVPAKHVKSRNESVKLLLRTFLNVHPNEELMKLQRTVEMPVGENGSSSNLNTSTSTVTLATGVDGVIDNLQHLDSNNIKTRLELLQVFLKLFNMLAVKESSSGEEHNSGLEFPQDFFDRLDKIVSAHNSKSLSGSLETSAQIEELNQHLSSRKNNNSGETSESRAQWEKLLTSALIKIPPACQSHQDLKQLYIECSAISKRAELQARTYRPNAEDAHETLQAFSKGGESFVEEIAKRSEKEKQAKLADVMKQYQIHLQHGEKEDDVNSNLGTMNGTMRSAGSKATYLTTSKKKELYLNEEMLRLFVSDFWGVSITSLFMMLCHMYVAPKPDYLNLIGGDASSEMNDAKLRMPLYTATNGHKVNEEELRYKKILLDAIYQICEEAGTLEAIVVKLEKQVASTPDAIRSSITNKNIIDALELLKKKGLLNMREPLPLAPQEGASVYQGYIKTRNVLVSRLLLSFLMAHPDDELEKLQQSIEANAKAVKKAK